MKKIIFHIILIAMIALNMSSSVFAADFNKDIGIGKSDISAPANILKGDKIKIYTTVHNNSAYDLTGVVKFYNERTGTYIGSDQPISILPKKTDDVFITWNADSTGAHKIAVRIVPWDKVGDNPNNNKIIKSIYVDIDSDKDGTGNRLDSDDDNDGVADIEDDFPLDPKESKDTDKDGIGNNEDTDDDNDSVADIKDDFPLDPKESKDTDKDGVGDNADVFPYDPKEWKDSDKDKLGDNADPNDSNHGPIPSVNAPGDAKINKKITFNANKSKDPDGKIIKYEWDFGDGKVDTGVIVNHSFEKSGQYLVSLKVTDDKKETRIQKMQVKVGVDWLFVVMISGLILLVLLIAGYFIRKHLNQKSNRKKPSKKKKK